MPQTITIMLTGPANSGKTSLCTRYISKKFTGESVSTFGCDFYSTEISDDLQVRLLDTAGNKNFPRPPSAYYQCTNVILLCVDPTEAEDEIQKKISSYIQTIKEGYENSNPPPILLVGTRSCEDNETKLKMLEKLAKNNNLNGAMIADAKTTVGVKEMFTHAIKLAQSYSKKPQNSLNCYQRAIKNAQENYQKQGLGFFKRSIPLQRSEVVENLKGALNNTSPQKALLEILKASVATKEDHEAHSFFARLGFTRSRLAKELDDALDVIVGTKAKKDNFLPRDIKPPKGVDKNYVDALHCIDIVLAAMRDAGRDPRVDSRELGELSSLYKEYKEKYLKIDFLTPDQVAQHVATDMQALVDKVNQKTPCQEYYECYYLGNALEKMVSCQYIDKTSLTLNKFGFLQYDETKVASETQQQLP